LIRDGTVQKNYVFFTSSKRLADDVQRLAFHAGYSASVQQKAGTYYKISDGHEGYVDSLRVIIIKSKNKPWINNVTKCRNNKRHKIDIIKYDGVVSCVEVPSHVFYMRENGIAHWTGNSSRSGQKVGFFSLRSRKKRIKKNIIL
jgi:replicative DNA helicase Mcm